MFPKKQDNLQTSTFIKKHIYHGKISDNSSQKEIDISEKMDSPFYKTHIANCIP